MASISRYVRDYGNKTFFEEPFNEIDNVVFSSLIYLNYEGIVPENRKYIRLEEAGIKYLEKYSYFEISKLGIAQKVSYQLLKQVVNTVRYKDVLMYNFKYIADSDRQFGAVCFKVKKNFTYVAFEGTDNLLSGWKEDFELSYKFPVPAQTLAIEYINKRVKFYDKNVMVGGHSKGGNLALVSSMFAKKLVNKKIKKIYSNDGPGLRKAEIESDNYKRVRDRLIHIVPNYSYIGVLLRNDKFKVIKSTRRDFMAHSVSTWQTDGTSFKEASLSKISSNLRESIILWLDEHDDEQRRKMIETVFEALEKSGIKDTNDFFNIKKSFNIVKNIRNVDDETKELVMSLIQFNINYLIENS